MILHDQQYIKYVNIHSLHIENGEQNLKSHNQY